MFAGYKFKNWKKKYLKLSKKYNKISDLEKNFEDIDVFITGSDQVWGPTSSGKYDEAYFLEFTTKKRYLTRLVLGILIFRENKRIIF